MAYGGRDIGSRGISEGRFGGNGGGFGAMGSPSAKNYKPLPMAAPKVKPQAPAAGPNLMRSFVPAAMLGQAGIPGLQDYMLNLPSYGYFGLPGQVRPQSMIMGGI